MKHILLLPFLLIALSLPGQSRITPYDLLPGINRNYKPSYEKDFPEWAQMLYLYPVNYHKICREFDKYIKTHPDAKSPVIRYFKIWRKVIEAYTDDEGEILLPDALQNDKNQEVISAGSDFREFENHKTSNKWTFLGPKETFWLNESNSVHNPKPCPWQVNVYSFDVAGDNQQILYAGTETGFVNKSVDKGINWIQTGRDYVFGGGITATVIHPFDHDIAYVAAGKQIHKTTDGGEQWNPLLSTLRFNADRLIIHPSNPDKLIAAGEDGLYVSTNAGQSWTSQWLSPTFDAEFKADNANVVYALTQISGNFALLLSTDGGMSFQTDQFFPQNYMESSGGLLAVTKANPTKILAVLLSANNTPYLLQGTYADAGASWKTLAAGRTTAFPMDNGQGFYDLALEISPVNENIILTGTTTLYKSLNGGNFFSAVGGYAGNFSIHPDIQDIKMLANGETWVATDGGMNLTTDNFTLQSNYHVRIKNLIGSDFWGFDQGWNEDITVGGRYHNGNTAIADFYGDKALRMGGAESPTGWVLKGKSRHVVFDDLGNGWILPKEVTQRPEGRFIFSKYPNMDEYGGRRGNLLHHPNYYGTLYLGEGSGFWKSTDSGVSWELLYNFPDRVRYTKISYSNPNVLYADIVNRGLYRSDDGGISWSFKPSLTSSPNGIAYWRGKLFFEISPYDENIIYACLQNGTWSSDIGKIFLSKDGGTTWKNLTDNVSEYLKCIIVQPGSDGKDIVYLFTNSIGNRSAKVYYRSEGMEEWMRYDNGYPSGMAVNIAIPFYRDNKIRSAGNAGVWEVPLLDSLYTPIVNPWVEKPIYNCYMDTVYLDDHSIISHSDVQWKWEIQPEPMWFDDLNKRNPKIIPGSKGSFDLTLTITKNGKTFSRKIPDMFTARTCPSVNDCDHPAKLPKNKWKLIYTNSQEFNDPGLAVMSFDDNPSTIWHTRWSTGSEPYPHEIQISLGDRYKISSFEYQTRQDGENGRIKEYELYISTDSLDWGTPVHTGSFQNTSAPQLIYFNTPVTGKYFRLKALSEVNGNSWASAAEFSMVGCLENPTSSPVDIFPENASAYPIPTENLLYLKLPGFSGPGKFSVFSTSGIPVMNGDIQEDANGHILNLSVLPEGVYMVNILSASGTRYRIKTIKI
jgi:photosystem II stability/assembly factor-like uncharacterized protein